MSRDDTQPANNSLVFPKPAELGSGTGAAIPAGADSAVEVKKIGQKPILILR
jgi:hypothetical protein